MNIVYLNNLEILNSKCMEIRTCCKAVEGKTTNKLTRKYLCRKFDDEKQKSKYQKEGKVCADEEGPQRSVEISKIIKSKAKIIVEKATSNLNKLTGMN